MARKPMVQCVPSHSIWKNPFDPLLYTTENVCGNKATGLLVSDEYLTEWDVVTPRATNISCCVRPNVYYIRTSDEVRMLGQ